MDSDSLTDRLDTPIEVHGRIPNTTDRIRRLARADAPHGAMVVADELTAARGRTGSAWSAPSGGVWTSTLLRPDFDADHVGRLTFAAGVAVADVVTSFGVDADLKWPNDVLVDGHKIAGILTESVHDGVPVAGKPVDEVSPGGEPELDYVTLGVGINANIDATDLSIDRPATSLRTETGGAVDRESVVVRLNRRLRERCTEVESARGFKQVPDDWRESSVTLGQRVVVQCRGQAAVSGIARDVSETGALVVDTETEVTEGECRRLRRA